MVKLIVTDIHITYTMHIRRYNLHLHCLGSHFLISDLKISTSFRFLSSRGTIFHTLDAKYRREFKRKRVVLTEFTEKSV